MQNSLTLGAQVWVLLQEAWAGESVLNVLEKETNFQQLNYLLAQS